MSEPDSQSEPTMEEILASIRRIISEEETEEGDGEEQEGASEAEGQDGEAEAEAEAPAEAAAAELAEDAEAPVEVPEEPPVAEPQPLDDEDILELTERVEDEFASEKSPADTPRPLIDDLLVSDSTAAAATSSLSDVMGAISQSNQRGVAIGGGRTLEEVVRDALHPVLKEWLDANLATLVERIVREEIKKMVRRAEEQ